MLTMEVAVSDFRGVREGDLVPCGDKPVHVLQWRRRGEVKAHLPSTRHPIRMSWLSSRGSNAMVGSSPSVVVSRGAGPRYQLAVEAAKQAVELSQPLDML